ncbi:hypothetical protein, partial [Niallia sp. NCCP-28]|uniref:hypothetical protein n=1 Tax=Niallia sp. NCCP-28 TaxID=2934712 RepID=UPI0020C06EAB
MIEVSLYYLMAGQIGKVCDCSRAILERKEEINNNVSIFYKKTFEKSLTKLREFYIIYLVADNENVKSDKKI